MFTNTSYVCASLCVFVREAEGEITSESAFRFRERGEIVVSEAIIVFLHLPVVMKRSLIKTELGRGL